MTNPNDIAVESALTAQHAGSTYAYVLDETGSARILHCATHERYVPVPAELDGHPITAIAHAAFAGLDATEELVLPENVTQIGWNAFAGCKRLRSIVFPSALDCTDKTWLLECDRIAEIVLPAAAETISADFLKSCHPQRMVIGRATRMVDAPPYWSACLREVAVDAKNPFIATDGCCLYSHDGTTLIKCLVEEEEYRVQPGCRTIAGKAFAFNSKLVRIHLPDSLEQIGEAAFLDTPLESFAAPPHLRRIGDRAFVRCAQLRNVMLNDGLTEIGEGPFRQCKALKRLVIPASVRSLGLHAIAETPLTACGSASTFAIDPANPTLFIQDGLLYQRNGTDLVLVDALNPLATEFNVHPGTTEIGANAFAGHAALTRIVLPEGLTDIGANAFDGCENLRSIEMPSTLRSIGTRGLFNAELESLRLPAALEHIGSCALAVDSTDGRVPSRRTPTLRDVRIDPANQRFFLESGVLCERVSDYARAVLYVGPDTDVVIPRAVTELGPYAFAGVRGIERFVLHDSIERIGTLGLAFTEAPNLLEIGYIAPSANGTAGSFSASWTEGMNFPSCTGRPCAASKTSGAAACMLRIHPIRGKYCLRALRNAINDGGIDVPALANGMDRMALYSRDPFERVRYMVERLADPTLLSSTMHANYDLTLKRSLPGLCKAIAIHGWHESFDILADLGYLNASTVVSAIDAVVETSDGAATAFLISLKEKRWGAHPDYSL